MALFGNDSKNQTQASGGASAQSDEAKMGDQSYFDEYASQGQDQFTPDMLSTPYLSMVQSQNAGGKKELMGTWFNSATGDNLGPMVKAVCMACKTAWIERDTVGQTFITVGRYEPGSIEVTKTMPPPGQRGFPKLTNPKSGNKVEELFVYALMLHDHPEMGILYFSPSALSMSACKAWNTKIRAQRLPSGKLAPIFAFAWELELGLVPKPGKNVDANDPLQCNSRLVKATRGEIVALDLFKSYVQPQIGVSRNLLAIAAPEAGDDAEE